MQPSSEPTPDQLYDKGTEAEKQFESTGDPAALERALACWQALLAEADFADAPERNQRIILNKAGKAYWSRYNSVSHASADLDQAFLHWSKALEMAPASSPDRAIYLNNIAGVFAKRYDAGQNVADLEAAVESGRKAAGIATGVQARMFQHNLATMLFLLWQRTLEPALLEEAEESERQSGFASPDFLAGHLNILAAGLLATYGNNGGDALLGEALHACERSIALTPENSPDLPLHLNNFAEGLHYRYLSTGNLADLTEAVNLWRRAEGILPADSPERPRMLHNLGKGLFAQYLRGEDPGILNAAIDLFDQAERLVPDKTALRGIILNALAAGVQARYEAAGSLDDLQRAIAAWEEALTLTPPDDASRPLRLDSLGVGLRTRFAALRDAADLDRAVDYLIEAVRLRPEGSPGRPGSFNNLANALGDRFTAFGEPADREAAEVSWRAASQSGLKSHPEAALAATRNWGNFEAAHGDWKAAAEAYSLGAEAVEHLFRVQLLREDKESWLHDARGLHQHGAYALARAGDASAAVTLLEKGRARLLADALERNRVHLERLPELGYVDLYERYKAAALRISAGERWEITEKQSAEAAPGIADLRDAHMQLDGAIEAIQQIAGYRDLFRPPTFEGIQKILAMPDCHAAVYLVVTHFGGAALAVDAAGARPIPLDLNLPALDKLLVSEQGGYLPAQLGQGSLPVALRQILPAIGSAVAGPVAAALRVTAEPREPVPHIVLIPTGSLALLPLHAALYEVDGKQRCLLDEFSISYAPSARVLGYAQDALAQCRPDAAAFLGISNPTTEGAQALPFAAMEVEEIAAFFPGRSKVLQGERADGPAVEQALDQAAYLHFACHGQFIANDPLRSAVLLSGAAKLTVGDLLARQLLSGSRLAVLSACQTAIADFTQLPDEFVGLPAGFLQAGAPTVIGSLWPVADISTALLMIELYRRHRNPPPGEPLDPARALRQAQLWLRGVSAGELTDVFAKYKAAAPDAPTAARMAYATAREQFVNFAVNPDPASKPFANAYHWAAFSCYGV
jgi:CHAT domain-containing protein